MNTENSKTNESNKFIYQFTDKLNLKNPNNKNTGLVNLSIYYTCKNIKSTYNNNKFKISAPTDGLIQFLTFNITLNLSSKNTKLWLKILPYKFTPINKKQDCFSNKDRLQTRVVISRNNETIREYKTRCL